MSTTRSNRDIKNKNADFEDELQWDQSFQKNQSKLVAAAKLAKQQIAQGQAQPMDYEQL